QRQLSNRMAAAYGLSQIPAAARSSTLPSDWLIPRKCRMVDSIVHIIDDDAAVRDSLAFLLATADIQSRQHESAEDFLANFKVEEAGCIITDMRMPGMDGLELLHKLQESKNSVPVIVVTGHGDVSLAVEAMKAGA